MLRVSFSSSRDRACRHCWISSFLDSLGKTATVVFVRNPLDIKQHLTNGPGFYPFNKNHRKPSKLCFFLICLPETFADAGDGEGTIWYNFESF